MKVYLKVYGVCGISTVNNKRAMYFILQKNFINIWGVVISGQRIFLMI